jgi:signal transduction histidine kinase
MNPSSNLAFTLRTGVLALFTAAASMAPAHANNAASKDEAVAIVKKAVAAIKTSGADKVYAEINTPAGKWIDRDLYVVVYGLDGMSLAHGANPKQTGVMLIDRKDIDGKEFIKERVELAKAKASFWQDYKFQNPATKKVEPKIMYCERLAETAVCAGVYK